ncbi:MAG: hypothetical protein NTX76_04040 [Alphaproteobacteria bacterium]|nr:hypothetical protein [Alphaproteobacteria bacterium]
MNRTLTSDNRFLKNEIDRKKMAANYSIIDIPGKTKFQIAVTNSTTPPKGEDGEDGVSEGVQSPEWMVKMDDKLESSVSDYEDHAILYGWYSESARHTTGDASNQLMTSATLKHSDLVLIIPNDGFAAALESMMNTGKAIKELTVVRLGNTGSLKVKLQSIVFATCRIKKYQQQLDRLILTLSITTKENTIFVYDDAGKSTGQMVSKVDYSKNTAQ